MEKSTRLIILTIGLLVILSIWSSAINDFLTIIFKDNINALLSHSINSIVLLLTLILLLQIPPFKEILEFFRKWAQK